jgi:hypothetical protein
LRPPPFSTTNPPHLLRGSRASFEARTTVGRRATHAAPPYYAREQQSASPSCTLARPARIRRRHQLRPPVCRPCHRATHTERCSRPAHACGRALCADTALAERCSRRAHAHGRALCAVDTSPGAPRPQSAAPIGLTPAVEPLRSQSAAPVGFTPAVEPSGQCTLPPGAARPRLRRLHVCKLAHVAPHAYTGGQRS